MFGFLRKNIVFHLCILIIISFTITIVAQTENGKKPRIIKYKIITYTNIEGKPVWARVIREDRDYVTLTYPEDSTLKTKTIHRDMIIENSVVHQTISEFDYWTNLADYFTANTWDFNNDGEDFAQARRCYEKAREIVMNLRGKDHALVRQIDKQIDDLENESQKWLDATQKKVKFDKLEFESQIQEQLIQISSSTTDNALAIENIQSTLEQIQLNSSQITNLKNEIKESFDNVSNDLKSISQDVEKNSLQIDRIWRIYEDPYYNTGRRRIVR